MERLKIKGVYTFTWVDKITGKVISKQKENTVCQGFFDAVFNLLDSTAVTLGLSYIAIGEYASSPALRSDTILENEFFRKEILSNSFDDDIFTSKVYLEEAEGNPTGDNLITEIGIFAGGSIAANSGTLVSRALVSVAKNSSSRIIVKWTLDTK